MTISDPKGVFIGKTVELKEMMINQKIFYRGRKTVPFSVGKCGRGYPVKFLGIRELDSEKTCPHCKQTVLSVMELEADYVIEFRCTACNKAMNATD